MKPPLLAAQFHKEPNHMNATTSQPGLFGQLAPLLAHRAVLITVSKLEEDQLQINICPRQLKEGENSALTIPLCVTGTAAELDSGLVQQVASFVASHVGLNTNLATIEKEIAEAEKAAREEAKKKQKVVGNGGKKASDTTSTAQPPAPPKPVPEQPPMLSLFDQQPQADVRPPVEAAPQTSSNPE
jgi:PRTRC genetic system protein E